MREILFRAKRIYNGEWVEGYYLYYSHMGKVEHIIVTEVPQIYSKMHTVIPETVGQYTGLTDKNGKKIFEGDILDENGHLFTVAYDQKWAKFKLFHDSKAIQYPEWNRGVLMKVIGNIHDNPELLEAD